MAGVVFTNFSVSHYFLYFVTLSIRLNKSIHDS
jgi:hypothetical protein